MPGRVRSAQATSRYTLPGRCRDGTAGKAAGYPTERENFPSEVVSQNCREHWDNAYRVFVGPDQPGVGSDEGVSHSPLPTVPARSGARDDSRLQAPVGMGVGGADVVGNAMLLTVRTKELVRRLVCLLTCLFVPRRANERRVVPLRLGTLWARHKVDMTVQVRAFRCRGHTRLATAWLY